MAKLRVTVQKLQTEGSVSREECLNVVVNVPGPKRDPKKLLPMTLLAFTGYHQQREMMNFLIENNASTFSKSVLTFVLATCIVFD